MYDARGVARADVRDVVDQDFLSRHEQATRLQELQLGRLGYIVASRHPSMGRMCTGAPFATDTRTGCGFVQARSVRVRRIANRTRGTNTP